MTTVSRHYFNGYHLGAYQALSSPQLHQLQMVFEQPPSPPGEVLAGRQSVTITHIDGLGPVAVKHYARGGFVRHINHNTYVNWPRSRGEKEFHWLAAVRQLGLAAVARRPFACDAFGMNLRSGMPPDDIH